MSETPSLRVVQLTPPGRGAVATLLIEGPQAVEAVGARFRARNGRPLNCLSSDRLVVGRFGPGVGEEVVVRRRSDLGVELHCHGGLAAVAMIENTLIELGGRTVAWQQWIVDHHEDPIAADASLALAEARTPRTASILLDQFHGALRRAMQSIDKALGAGNTQPANEQIETLLARSGVGLHTVRPWRVVLAGGPNVGKSSLINALVGYPREIGHPSPGTTRDVLTAETVVDGWPVQLSDTAGLDRGTDPIGQAGIRLAREKLAEAELVVLVFDLSTPWSESDQTLAEAWPKALCVHNKSDLPPAAGPRPLGLAVSAITGSGLVMLLRAMADRLVAEPPPPSAAVPFTAEQIEQLDRLRRRRQTG